MTVQTNDNIWFDKYSPVVNPTGEGGYGVDDKQYMFETYGADLAKVEEAAKENPLKVWTIVTGDDGGEYIVAGMHFVNRMGYLITEKEAESEFEEYLFMEPDEDELDEDED